MLSIRFLPTLAAIFALSAPAFAQNPAKLASGTRFDLMAEPAVGAIDNATILKGGGSMQRMTWIAAQDQPRSYTCSFNVIHFGWFEIIVQFTPQNSGNVQLSLMGPWQESAGAGSPIFKQEVLWDGLTATNSTILNGGFESVSGTLPGNWTRSGSDAASDAGPVAPVEGSRYARTWHNSVLRQNIPVTGGQVVTLRFYSRAHTPEGFTDMKRIQDANSPAHQARLMFMRGVNLGNYLEAPAGQNWGQTYSEADFIQIRAEGFDHVRLPARWNDYTGPAPDFIISETFAAKVDALVTNAVNHGLAAIVNIHHFDEFTTDPAAQTAKFYRLWEQIAARYANQPAGVAFELLNEPKDAATTTVLNPIYAEAITRIRATNPDRVIFVGPGQFNSIDQLSALQLPDNDTNLIVTVHSYAPFLFTHQGATWTGDATATRGIVFPGPPATPLSPAPAAAGTQWVVDWINQYDTLPTAQNPSSKSAFVGDLELAKMWSDYYGRPVHVGEFGCYELADAASRARFYTEMRAEMDRLGLGWAMWDWKAGFKYWDGQQNRPAPGLPAAIFPEQVLKVPSKGRVQLESAVGKHIRVRRAATLDTAASLWAPIDDRVMASPVLDFTDPNPPTGSAFYVIEWVK